MTRAAKWKTAEVVTLDRPADLLPGLEPPTLQRQ
jgi:hypothetical protein